MSIPISILAPLLAAFVLGGAPGAPVLLQGDHGYAPLAGKFEDGAVIDARGGSWRLNNSRNANPTPRQGCKVGNLPTNPYPLRISGARGGTLLGGHIIGEVPTGSAHTDTYCNSAGLMVQAADFTVQGLRVDQAWDGVRTIPPGGGVRLDGVWVNGARDDCVENDRLTGLDITDSLLDRCFSGLSLDRGACKARCAAPPGPPPYRLHRVLMRISPYPLRTRDGGVEHKGGFFFKTSKPTPPTIEVTESVLAFDDIRASNYPRIGQAWGKIGRCANNRLLYLGGEALPEGFPQPPACFTVVTGAEARRQWERERSDWLARHPH